MANELTVTRLFTKVVDFTKTTMGSRNDTWYTLMEIAEETNDPDLWVRIGSEMQRVSQTYDDISGKVADRYVERAPDDAFRACMHGSLNRYRNWQDRRIRLSR